MVDEYELVSHQELDLLRSELKRLRDDRSSFPLPSLPDADEISPVPPDVIRSLNTSLLRLNVAFEKQLLFLDRVQKEMAQAPSQDDRLSKIEAQNEKISAGIIAMVNMVRDQQIQINQLSMLLKGMHSKIEEVRLQRRSAFRIPPIEQPRREVSIKNQGGPFEIEIPRPISQDIIAEEAKESYPSVSMVAPPTVPEEIPLPPKKNLLSRFVKT
jgi:hypothetical protein